MDETVVNGAQIFYKVQFGIDDSEDDPNAKRSKFVNIPRETWDLSTAGL
jgi:hypothetical protein